MTRDRGVGARLAIHNSDNTTLNVTHGVSHRAVHFIELNPLVTTRRIY